MNGRYILPIGKVRRGCKLDYPDCIGGTTGRVFTSPSLIPIISEVSEIPVDRAIRIRRVKFSDPPGNQLVLYLCSDNGFECLLAYR